MQLLCVCKRDASKVYGASGRQLPKLIEVGTNDLRYFGIAANGLAVDSKDDALPVARHLYRAGTNGLGDDLTRGQCQRTAPQTQAHPVAQRRYRERLREEFSVIKPVAL